MGLSKHKIPFANMNARFLWAHLQLHSISDTDRVKFESDIISTLSQLPNTLQESYKAIHNRIQAMGQKARTVSTNALNWLIAAQRTLSIDEFIAAVSRTSAMTDDTISIQRLLDVCCGLVILDAEIGTFRFIHATAQEYFSSLDDFSKHRSHSTVVQRCLGTYLWGDFATDNLVGYSTCYWPIHYETLGDTDASTAINPGMLEFLTAEEHFEDWLDNLTDEILENLYMASGILATKLNATRSDPPSPLFLVCCFGIEEALKLPDMEFSTGLNQKNRDGYSALYLAARWGHTSLVRLLLDRGANFDSHGSKSGGPLQAAAFGGYLETVSLLIERGALLHSNPGSSNFSSPLQAAIASGREPIIQALLDGGFLLADQGQFDDAIQAASFKGYADIVQQLLDGKAGTFAPKEAHDPLQVALYGRKERRAKQLLSRCPDINAKQGYFGNALQAAIAGGKLSLVEAVVAAGAQLDQRGRFGYPTRAAAIRGRAEIIEFLIAKGADVNAGDGWVGGALEAAAAEGNVDVLIVLLRHGANIDASGGFFGDVLQAASFGGHEKAVVLLLANGAQINGRPSGHYPPSRFGNAIEAAAFAGHEAIVNLLHKNGARLESFDWPMVQCSRGSPKRGVLPEVHNESALSDFRSGMGPLTEAARQGNLSMVKLLLRLGARTDPYKDYWPLHIAAFRGHSKVVQYLLDNGAAVDGICSAFGTPLNAALEREQFELAELLLGHGANIDEQWGLRWGSGYSSSWGTALQVFSERGMANVVRFLLERHANINDQGGDNGSALQVACDTGQLDIVRLLVERGADIEAPGKSKGTAFEAAYAAGHLDIVRFLAESHCDIAPGLNCASEHGHLHVIR